MSSNLHRLNLVVPGSAKHTARAQIMEEVIEEIAQNVKLVQAAIFGFRRIERALYYLNSWDRPAVELTRQQIAAKARCALSTINNDLLAINNLFDAIGLRLQHWESGGLRVNDGIEEVVPSVYCWPSPGGSIIEESNEKIELAIANKIIPARDEQAERRIVKEMTFKKIEDPYMQELRREREVNKQVREAKRINKAIEVKAKETTAGRKVLDFPNGRPLPLKEAIAQAVAGWRSSYTTITLDEAIAAVRECWLAKEGR